jgi:hypothetical protein
MVSVSAESKGVICTKIVQNSRVLGTAHSKGLSYGKRGPGQQKKRQMSAAGQRIIHWGI